MPDKPVILLFLKAPVRGQVKSRLAAAAGEEAALELYGNFILDILDTVKKSGYPFRICFYPSGEKKAVSDRLGEYPAVPQEGDDLGARMENAFSRAFSEGFTRAVLIGSDIPDLPVTVLTEALDSLKANDSVVGPAGDGGYYLIGFQKGSFLPLVFRGITWSTNTVFRKTMNILKGASLRVHLAPEWKDVDTLDDLRDLFGRNRSTAFDKSRTMAYLIRHRDRLFP